MAEEITPRQLLEKAEKEGVADEPIFMCVLYNGGVYPVGDPLRVGFMCSEDGGGICIDTFLDLHGYNNQ